MAETGIRNRFGVSINIHLNANLHSSIFAMQQTIRTRSNMISCIIARAPNASPISS
jgi:hypothetical protein